VKLASLKPGRDGALVVVSRDLAWCAPADSIAPTLQAALDNWDWCAPFLEALANSLEMGAVPASASMSMTRPVPCRAPTSGRTARPM